MKPISFNRGNPLHVQGAQALVVLVPKGGLSDGYLYHCLDSGISLIPLIDQACAECPAPGDITVTKIPRWLSEGLHIKNFIIIQDSERCLEETLKFALLEGRKEGIQKVIIPTFGIPPYSTPTDAGKPGDPLEELAQAVIPFLHDDDGMDITIMCSKSEEKEILKHLDLALLP